MSACICRCEILACNVNACREYMSLLAGGGGAKIQKGPKYPTGSEVRNFSFFLKILDRLPHELVFENNSPGPRG